jgi:hypothetical protein
MPNRFVCALSASILALSASAAQAQSTPAQPAPPTPVKDEAPAVAPVTVTAGAPPQVVQNQAHGFVESVTAPTAELEQIARWHDPVCVNVVGLIPDLAARVRARVETVAKALSLGVGKPGCAANIEIVFTDKPQAFMDDVAKRRENVLGYYHHHERDKLKTVTRPIQAWYTTATAGSGGFNAGLEFAYIKSAVPVDPRVTGVQLHDEVIDDPDNRPPAGCADSPHFTACLKAVLKNALVVADANRLQGQDLGMLSDYLALVSLAQIKSLDQCYALPSVIDVLAESACPGRDPPDGLTAGDAAYLTALYQADLQAKKSGERGDIANRMAKILTKAAAGGR